MRFGGVEYSHPVGQPSPASVSRILPSSQMEAVPMKPQLPTSASRSPRSPRPRRPRPAFFFCGVDHSRDRISVDSCGICPFVTGSLHWAQRPRGAPVPWCVSEAPASIRPMNPSVGVWVVSAFLLLRMAQLWTQVRRPLVPAFKSLGRRLRSACWTM